MTTPLTPSSKYFERIAFDDEQHPRSIEFTPSASGEALPDEYQEFKEKIEEGIFTLNQVVSRQPYTASEY